MVNRERIAGAIAQGMGYEATPREINDELSLLVRYITAGWRQGLYVGFVDCWQVESGGGLSAAFTHLSDEQRELIGSSSSQEDLESAAMAYLESKADILSELTTDLVYLRFDASGRAGEVWFPMDELEGFE